MNKSLLLLILIVCRPEAAVADLTRLVDEQTIAAIAEETSGVSAKRNLDTITLYHRTRAGSQFRQAAEYVQGQLQDYGFDQV